MVIFKLAIIFGLFLFLLGACSITQPVPQVICPQIEKYPSEMQLKAAKELKELKIDNKAPILRQFILDYQALRERLKAVNCK